MVSIPKWVEVFFSPQLNEIKGELKAINAEIRRLETKIDSLDERVNVRMSALSEKVRA